MLFSSPTFLVFFLSYFLIHLALPRPYRLHLIIAGSTIFYAWWRVEYVWVPFVLMAIAYAAGLIMAEADSRRARRCRLLAGIAVLFLPLLVFKYADFLYRDVLGLAFGFSDRLLDLPLPLGISFITFTLAAYLVDVHRGKFPTVSAPQMMLGYVLFFPHLIAGPILRPGELIPQLQRPRNALSVHFTAGIALFTVGLVKKLVFADQIGGLVDAVYAAGASPSGPAALLAIHGFAVQIYCDFSGYTDMALGLAMLLGVRLPANFWRPYCAGSLVEFWRRWHVTLSYWLRDYLYIPLGGNRSGLSRRMRNIVVTMVLGGLWHGASWTFVIWGFLHGFGVAAVHLFQTSRAGRALAIPRWVGVLLSFYFVTLAWVFFRAESVPQAGRILAAPLSGAWHHPLDELSANSFPILLMAVFFLLHRFDDHRRVKLAARRLRREILWPLIALLWVLCIAVSQGSSAKFIYFDF